MRNPWLDIPLADYEAHMASAEVAQAQLLSTILSDEIRALQPRSIAVIGCAGGNGFASIPPESIPRVVGIDLNAGYLASTSERFGTRFESLELIHADIGAQPPACGAVELAYAALVLEYVDLDRALPNLRTMLEAGGSLLTVVQLPSPHVPAVTPSPYLSLALLESIMKPVSPAALRAAAAGAGLREIASTEHVAVAKRFVAQRFKAG